ncbi:alpha,alpha-trehalose-phosphate synthase (UDP-forming) [Thalassobaculum fulvum]|uniref:Trehalose-6-phosphate synthase n=1 Tax=Thalassobaculum fulvum TaxID=1633335 RepID=A0A918XST9_9PROT|nr:trehalose-6-phosphate synthase [Thalassobaculum fulvum]GHD53149.1 alpha,alpha-trehalose-phosphate synthase (UDP-forming) [Thalassobaculum fulvum]
MSRLVVVSNRVAPIQEGKQSSGGLAVAVQEALSEVGGVWFGWSGEIYTSGSSRVKTETKGRITYATMPLARRDYDAFYKGYANATLWPLFHYRMEFVEYQRSYVAGYRRVNEEFAGRLSSMLEPDDLIWVHDYHLIPLGRDLRMMGHRNRIGFFLHIPFPPPDLLTACSDHAYLVQSLCAYDVVGFQTENDVRNFLAYIRTIAGGSVGRNGRFEAYGERSRACAFPIGIYPDQLASQAAASARSRQTRRLVESLAGKDLIVGVDRLDYSKGLDRRFDAYETLLEAAPGLRGHVSYMQIAPPSRSDVQSYRAIREVLEGKAGRINGRFAEFDWVPLRYLNKSFQRDQLTGFFRAARVGFVTPLRDGMNLVAKEYVACQDPEDPGVLVLSQFAGAAAELDGAVTVNPYDHEYVADGLQRALAMPVEERRARWTSMMSALRANNLGVWRRSFLRALQGR